MIILKNLIALTIVAGKVTTAAGVDRLKRQEIPDKALTQTVATIHSNFPSCYVDLVAIFTQLDPSLLPFHQTLKYTRGPAWSNRYDYWSQVNTASSLLKHLKCVFYSIILQRAPGLSVVADDDFLPLHVKPSENSTGIFLSSNSFQNGP